METVTDSFRSRELVSNDELQTLLNSLTLDQIRTAVSLLSPHKKIALKSHKDAMEGLLRTHRSTEHIRSALLDAESDTPFKHCVFSKFSAANLAEKILDQFELKAGASNGYRIRISYVRELGNCVSLTLEHQVTVTEWTETSPGTKKKVESVTRHPIIARLYRNAGLAVFFYPGFSQGAGSPRNSAIGYEELLQDACSLLSKKLNAGFTSFSSRKCISVLLEGGNSRVKVVRSDVDSAGGRVSLSSTGQQHSVEEVLADYLGDLDSSVRSIVLEKGRRALSSAMANVVVLYWYEENVFTRLKFWDLGTEMLFVWKGVSPSYRVAEEIVGMFQSTHALLQGQIQVDGISPVEWISRSSAGAIIRVAEVATAFELDGVAAKQCMLTAMKIGLVQPVYRLKTNILLHDTPNDWTYDPSTLNKIFASDDGAVVDGTDPRMIEVAFLRVDAGSAQ